MPTDKKFTGQRLDSTGLYYYGARYYDATIGRFISPDTIVPDIMNPQSLNRYSYCFNNPLKYVDQNGHNPWDETKRWLQGWWWDIRCKVNYAYQTLINMSAAANESPYVGIALILLGGIQGASNWKSFTSASRSGPSVQSILKQLASMETRELATKLSSSLRGGISNFSLNNNQARQWYLAAEKRIPEICNGIEKEQRAKMAFEFRNAIRTETRNLMSDRAEADRLFGKEQNMTWEEITEKYTNRLNKKGDSWTNDDLWDAIYEASQRSRESANIASGVTEQ